MTSPLPLPVVLGPEAIPNPVADAVLDGAVVASPDIALLEVTGGGAVACMQGLLTNDLDKPGDGSYLYAAVLTPKGMVVTDLWAARSATGISLRVPRAGLEGLLPALQRSLPPRLARVTELSGDHTALHLVGPRAAAVAAKAGVAVPPEGRIASAVTGGMMALVAQPPGGMPFAIEIVTSIANAKTLRARLCEAGALEGDSGALALARIVAGWPALGAEIDDRTLPQEVRFDELGGISYTKGCYVGQETVARLHFRGHANHLLRGLLWDDPPDPSDPTVLQDDRPRGRVTSLAWVPGVDRWIGLGILRREVDLEATVVAGGRVATATALPFPLEG